MRFPFLSPLLRNNLLKKMQYHLVYVYIWHVTCTCTAEISKNIYISTTVGTTGIFSAVRGIFEINQCMIAKETCKHNLTMRILLNKWRDFERKMNLWPLWAALDAYSLLFDTKYSWTSRFFTYASRSLYKLQELASM